MKIIEQMERYCDSEDILKHIYGISSEEVFDYVIVAPTWGLNNIAPENSIEYTELHNDRFSRSYDVRVGDKRILYTVLFVGAPNIVDFCLACYKLKCDNFIFVGSAGAIVKDLSLGDCVIPSTAISCNGASMLLSNSIKQNFMEKSYSDPELREKVATACKNIGFNVLDEVVVSVDSILAEYSHLDEFRTNGAKLVEMEVATFFESMKVINKKGVALLLISDNSANGENLVSDNRDPKNIYKQNRSRIFEVISQL